MNRAGSHVTLERREPEKHRVVVPDHPTLRVGTLNQILRAVADHKGVTRSDLLEDL
ncbi:MAG TPA: type II toxin-antitoxin system HicA family toxin [Thermoanaerobaculia bacterium]|nr:type II toxin-antitoxin system HicA family toxin [Thermoanaerobaculia bacterium]